MKRIATHALNSRNGKGRAARAALCLFIAVAACVPRHVNAFGEEHGSDIDTHEHVSTHHLYLTRALATCAGFASSGTPDPFYAPQAAERIAIADQLSDSERLHAGSATFTNCSAKPYAMPTPEALACPAGTGSASVLPLTGEAHVSAVLPIPTWDPRSGCFTSRFGPYSNDFHFPDAARVAVLRDWAFGDTPALTGTARFSFGGWLGSPWTADCNASRAETVDTGSVVAGSLEALGIYLHAIGDFHSHAQCLAHWADRDNPPWPTHTISTAQTGCAFIDHARELGCPAESTHDSVLAPAPSAPYVQHAEAAALAVYDELRRYAQQQGLAPRLGDTPAHRAWLAQHVHRFVTGWPWLGGGEGRRAFAQRIAEACAVLAPATLPAGLPRQPDETDCPR